MPAHNAVANQEKAVSSGWDAAIDLPVGDITCDDITCDDIVADIIAATGKITTTAGAATTGGIGYATGAGGAVTQGTSLTTTVAITKMCGTITTFAASPTTPGTTDIAGGEEKSFTVTATNLMGATDVVIVTVAAQFTQGNIITYVKSVAAGSFVLAYSNLDVVTATAGSAIINYAIIKAVAA